MYPTGYDVERVLRNGDLCRFRPITQSDGPGLRAFFDDLGPESRYYRFFGVKDSLTEEEIEESLDVDYQQRMAFVALVDGHLVGIGRYVPVEGEPFEAEVAFAVADAHQGHGIATILLELLADYAQHHAVRRFLAYVLPDNEFMMRVFRHSGYELHRELDGGVYVVEFSVVAD